MKWNSPGESNQAPAVSKRCLEVFKHLRASKKHGTFATPGSVLIFLGGGLHVYVDFLGGLQDL